MHLWPNFLYYLIIKYYVIIYNIIASWTQNKSFIKFLQEIPKVIFVAYMINSIM